MRNTILSILVLYGLWATFLKLDYFNASFGNQVLKHAKINAESGDPKKIYRLASIYEKGMNVKKDLRTAAEYYTLSAERGYAEAQYKIGMWYQKGTGLEQSDEQAKKWFTLAAGQGHTFAELELLKLQENQIQVQNPTLKYVDKEEFNKLYINNEQLLSEIENNLDDYQAEFKNDTIYHQLSRIYFHSNQRQKGLISKDKIQYLTNQKFMLELYAGMMLELLKTHDNKEAFSMLESTDIEAVINSIKLTPLPSTVRKHTRNNLVTQAEVNSTLCRLAAKFLISEHRRTDLETLMHLKACEKFVILDHYLFAYFLLNEEYSKALQFFIDAKNGKTGLRKIKKLNSLLTGCKPEDTQNKESPDSNSLELLSFLETFNSSGEDQDKYLLSRFLYITNKKDLAEEVAYKIDDMDIRVQALLPIYYNYLKNNDEKNAFRILRSWNALSKPPLTIGGWGNIDARQWYNVSRRDVAYLASIKTPLAYKIALKYEHPRTRFTALMAFNDSSLDNSAELFPNCEHIRKCILDEMHIIAEQEKDDAARDYMYQKISALARSIGLIDIAKTAIDKQVDPKRMVCHYDMCSGGVKPDFTDPKVVKARHLKMCQEKLEQSSDKLLAVISNMEKGQRFSQKESSPYKYVTEEDSKHNRKIKIDALNALRCHIHTGLYKEYLEKPELLGEDRDLYLNELSKSIAGWGALVSVNKKDRLFAALQITDRNKREMAVERIFNYSRSNEIDSELLPVLDNYMQKYPDIFNETRQIPSRLEEDPKIDDVQSFIRILERFLYARAVHKRYRSAFVSEDTPSPFERIEKVKKLLKKRPILSTFLAENGAYHGKSCLYMEDHIPTPDTITPLHITEQPRGFRECIINLVDAGRYGQAIYMSQHMFPNKNYIIRTKLEILQREISLVNLAYKMSTMERNRPFSSSDYEFSGTGFAYLRSRPYNSKKPYARCPIGDVFKPNLLNHLD